jgi:hypothetical protein
MTLWLMTLWPAVGATGVSALASAFLRQPSAVTASAATVPSTAAAAFVAGRAFAAFPAHILAPRWAAPSAAAADKARCRADGHDQGQQQEDKGLNFAYRTLFLHESSRLGFVFLRRFVDIVLYFRRKCHAQRNNTCFSHESLLLP